MQSPAEIVLYDRAGGRNISGKNMADRIISTGEDFVKWCAERRQGETLSEKELKAEEKQEKGCQEEGAQEKEIEKVCLVIADLADFVQMLAEQSAFEGEIIRNFEKEVKEKKVAILAVSLPGRESELMGSFFYELFIRKQCGIHLGGNAAAQRLLSFEDLSYAQLGKKEETGIGYLKLGPGTESRRILMPKFEKDEVKDDFSGCTDTGPGSDL